MNKIIPVVLVLVIAVAVVIYFKNNSNPDKVDNHESVVKKDITITDEDKVKGNPNAKVEIVEYYDFQCPACGNFSQSFSKVWRIVKSDVKFVMRYFPLPFHTYAREAAVFAEAANMQGKFWELEATIFNNQAEWSEATSTAKAQTYFYSYAKSVGIDTDQLKQDIEANRSAFNTKIDADIKSGEDLGVQGTPTVFINGEVMQLSGDPTVLLQTIKGHIEKNK